MASIPVVLIAFVAAILLYSGLGLTMARWLAPKWAIPAGLAPCLGWGLCAAVSLPLQSLIGFNQVSTAVLLGLALPARLRRTARRLTGSGRASAWPRLWWRF